LGAFYPHPAHKSALTAEAATHCLAPGKREWPQRPPGHCSPAPRSTTPGPAGSGRAKTLPRWLLPDTNRRFVKERTGPDRDEGLHYFSMSPNRAIGADKSIFFFALTAAQPLTILAWFNYGSLQSLRSRFIAAPASAVSGHGSITGVSGWQPRRTSDHVLASAAQSSCA